MLTYEFYISTYLPDCSGGGWHSSFSTTNKHPLCRHNGDACNSAVLPYFDVGNETKRRHAGIVVFLGYNALFHQWTIQRIHITVIVVYPYMQLMGDKMNTNSAEPRLKSFDSIFVAGIDLPQYGAMDSYSPVHPAHKTNIGCATLEESATFCLVDRYLPRIGVRFQTRLHRVWNLLIPHESQVSIYHNQYVMDSLSCRMDIYAYKSRSNVRDI